MPLYEYQCKKCERKFETLISFRDSEKPVECPHCGSKETGKLLSTFCASMGKSTKGASGCPGNGT